MKILTEQEQLIKRRTEIYTAAIFQEGEIEKVRIEKSHYENAWFNRDESIKVFSLQISAMEQVLKGLNEYKDYLTTRIELTENK